MNNAQKSFSNRNVQTRQIKNGCQYPSPQTRPLFHDLIEVIPLHSHNMHRWDSVKKSWININFCAYKHQVPIVQMSRQTSASPLSTNNSRLRSTGSFFPPAIDCTFSSASLMSSSPSTSEDLTSVSRSESPWCQRKGTCKIRSSCITLFFKELRVRSYKSYLY